MNNDEILIVKDPEHDIYYALIKDIFDHDDERSIIASGKDEFETLKEATEKYIKALKNCHKFIKDFCFHVCDADFIPTNDICVECKRINKPLDDKCRNF